MPTRPHSLLSEGYIANITASNETLNDFGLGTLHSTSRNVLTQFILKEQLLLESVRHNNTNSKWLAELTDVFLFFSQRRTHLHQNSMSNCGSSPLFWESTREMGSLRADRGTSIYRSTLPLLFFVGLVDRLVVLPFSLEMLVTPGMYAIFGGDLARGLLRRFIKKVRS